MKVSVITPSYNQGGFIERTLLSVANQKGANIEHVVVDGGSTDETLEILERYGTSIRWISEKDNGQADAVNKGILCTEGEIIGWLNSDDIYYPEAINQVVLFFLANPDVDVVYGMADHIDLSDQAFEAYPTEGWSFERLKKVCFICQPALFFRRRIVEKYGYLDDSLNYCMDYEYWLRLANGGVKFAYLEKKLAGSRLYPGNKTLGFRVDVHKEINDMLRKSFGFVPARWIFNYAHVIADSRFNRSVTPKRYLVKMLAALIYGALRWNGKASFGMVKRLSLGGEAVLYADRKAK